MDSTIDTFSVLLDGDSDCVKVTSVAEVLRKHFGLYDRTTLEKEDLVIESLSTSETRKTHEVLIGVLLVLPQSLEGNFGVREVCEAPCALQFRDHTGVVDCIFPDFGLDYLEKRVCLFRWHCIPTISTFSLLANEISLGANGSRFYLELLSLPIFFGDIASLRAKCADIYDSWSNLENKREEITKSLIKAEKMLINVTGVANSRSGVFIEPGGTMNFVVKFIRSNNISSEGLVKIIFSCKEEHTSSLGKFLSLYAHINIGEVYTISNLFPVHGLPSGAMKNVLRFNTATSRILTAKQNLNKEMYSPNSDYLIMSKSMLTENCCDSEVSLKVPPDVISYSGYITEIINVKLGLYELDEAHTLYVTFYNKVDISLGLRVGTQIEVYNAHVFKEDHHWVLVLCNYSSLVIKKVPEIMGVCYAPRKQEREDIKALLKDFTPYGLVLFFKVVLHICKIFSEASDLQSIVNPWHISRDLVSKIVQKKRIHTGSFLEMMINDHCECLDECTRIRVRIMKVSDFNESRDSHRVKKLMNTNESPKQVLIGIFLLDSDGDIIFYDGVGVIRALIKLNPSRNKNSRDLPISLVFGRLWLIQSFYIVSNTKWGEQFISLDVFSEENMSIPFVQEGYMDYHLSNNKYKIGSSRIRSDAPIIFTSFMCKVPFLNLTNRHDFLNAISDLNDFHIFYPMYTQINKIHGITSNLSTEKVMRCFLTLKEDKSISAYFCAKNVYLLTNIITKETVGLVNGEPRRWIKIKPGLEFFFLNLGNYDKRKEFKSHTIEIEVFLKSNNLLNKISNEILSLPQKPQGYNVGFLAMWNYLFKSKKFNPPGDYSEIERIFKYSTPITLRGLIVKKTLIDRSEILIGSNRISGSLGCKDNESSLKLVSITILDIDTLDTISLYFDEYQIDHSDCIPGLSIRITNVLVGNLGKSKLLGVGTPQSALRTKIPRESSYDGELTCLCNIRDFSEQNLKLYLLLSITYIKHIELYVTPGFGEMYPDREHLSDFNGLNGLGDMNIGAKAICFVQDSTGKAIVMLNGASIVLNLLEALSSAAKDKLTSLIQKEVSSIKNKRAESAGLHCEGENIHGNIVLATYSDDKSPDIDFAGLKANSYIKENIDKVKSVNEALKLCVSQGANRRKLLRIHTQGNFVCRIMKKTNEKSLDGRLPKSTKHPDKPPDDITWIYTDQVSPAHTITETEACMRQINKIINSQE